MTLVIVLAIITVIPLIILGYGYRQERERFGGARVDTRRSDPRPLIQILITLVGLTGGGYIIISGNYSEGVQTTAGGIIGMIFGFWLK